MKPVKVGLLGLGVVGGATAVVLMRNAKEIARRAGRGIVVDYAATRRFVTESRATELGLQNARLTQQATDVVCDPEVEVVVELIGGTTIAYTLVMEAIKQGKHVVTANKALIALHGNEIFAAAQEQGVMIAFEGAVAGGIPVIKALREGLAANHIQWLAGIINGTGNFILTEMRDHQRDFADVLKEAQALGYAEADPTFDIEGIDAAHKLTILSALAFGVPLQFDKTYVEGITHITAEDVVYANELGYRIKHLGIARRTKHGIEQRVHPTLIPEKRLIANVDGVMNAIVVNGDAAGSTLYYGAGAGAEPTASSVVADIIDVVRTMTADSHHRVPHLAFQPSRLVDTPILSINEVETAFYLRLCAKDRPGVLAEITKILGDREISIEAFIQKEPAENADQVTIIMLTHPVLEGNINLALTEIEQLDAVCGSISRIRVETLG